MELAMNDTVHAAGVSMPLADVPHQRQTDAPVQAGSVSLGDLDGVEVGIWEMSAGSMRDVEADEFFVVISGNATVEFADGTPTLHLRAGSVARLAEGTHTLWTVTAALRKVYLTPMR